MELENIFDGLNVEQMARNALETAAAKYHRRPDVKEKNAFITWLRDLSESMNRTAKKSV